VGILGILLGLEEIGFFRQVRLAIAGPDQSADLVQRVIGDAHRVRAHIGDQRDGALLAEFHALVKPLR
jgi:hypothetical protein